MAPEGALASVAAASACVLYAKLLTSEKALCPESDASVKSIDAVLGKVRLPGFWPSKSKCPRWTSITPLPQDRHLSWHHWQPSVC